MPHREVVSQADFSGLKVSNQSLGSSIAERARISMSEFKVQGSPFETRRGHRSSGRTVEDPEHGTRNPERRSTALKYLGFVAHVLLSAIVLASLGCAKSAQPQARPPDVAVVKVEQKDVPIWREWIGTLDGLVNAQIKPQVTGYLLRQNYTDGAFVKKGQLLFEIDPRTFQAAVDQAKGQLANAEGQVAQAQANEVKTQQDVTRYTPLAKEQAIAQQDLDNAIQANAAAKAQVEAAKAQVEAAKAVYDQRIAAYRQTVLTGFQQVEDNLSTLRILENQASVQDGAVQASLQAEQLTLNQYQAGTVAYTSVVTAQATSLSNRQSALTILQNRLLASVTLIEALGGGWDSTQLPTGDALRSDAGR